MWTASLSFSAKCNWLLRKYDKTIRVRRGWVEEYCFNRIQLQSADENYRFVCRFYPSFSTTQPAECCADYATYPVLCFPGVIPRTPKNAHDECPRMPTTSQSLLGSYHQHRSGQNQDLKTLKTTKASFLTIL